jgi:type I restriction enzyme M protein
MALKKSELYSSLWQSCDELRGGMDASQYKDYDLFLLFVKYVSDKYAGQPFAPITIPPGASFADMVALKGKPDIGDQINKKIIGPLGLANKLSDLPDFDDPTKLGSSDEKVERLTNLIAIFENKALDFSKNRADGDDILGDAYEYLMRHFATESGKSKGQFYTPSEVSTIMARIIGIHEAVTSNNTTAYDPTCGSGSLLLKVGDAATADITLYGQEKDSATAGLARMNMILHNNPTALIEGGHSTLAKPKFQDGSSIKTFDYVVANPPFSDKRWGTGFDPLNDPAGRFTGFGVPPAKQGDYAYLLHIVRSLKSTGKGACILPHGVLFRGNAEADIRKNLVRKGYIVGIIGLPANLFYGTGIPACIIVLDKQDAHTRKGIFMVDASSGYMKDGPKNRLRDRDIHKICDVFTKRTVVAKYARMVSLAEIEKNDFNLNLPRYIDSQTPEDLQDIAGHLQGGIPSTDVDALQPYWAVCPKLRTSLFQPNRPGYLNMVVGKASIKPVIYGHPEFTTFIGGMNTLFAQWQSKTATTLKALDVGCHPKQVIAALAEDLLIHYTDKPLMDAYSVYQHLLDYWATVMQDDFYLIAADGWKAETTRISVTNKKGKVVDKGWFCDLVPKQLVVDRHFPTEQAHVLQLESTLSTLESDIVALQEEHSGEGGALKDVDTKSEAQWAWHEALLEAWQISQPKPYRKYVDASSRRDGAWAELKSLEANPLLLAHANSKGKLTQAIINDRFKNAENANERALLQLHKTAAAEYKESRALAAELLESATAAIDERLQNEPDHFDLTDLRVLRAYLSLLEKISETKSELSAAEADLDRKAYEKYPLLTKAEVQTLVVDDKWLATLSAAIHGEMNRISQGLTQRVKELADRYETPMPQMVRRVSELEAKVNQHLAKMGFAWN